MNRPNSKKFEPTRFMKYLIPIALVILSLGLVITLLIVILS